MVPPQTAPNPAQHLYSSHLPGSLLQMQAGWGWGLYPTRVQGPYEGPLQRARQVSHETGPIWSPQDHPAGVRTRDKCFPGKPA